MAEDGTQRKKLSAGVVHWVSWGIPASKRAISLLWCPFRMHRRLSEGVVASSRYPKHWLTVGDPAREFTMTQSAPLMVLPDRMSLWWCR
ncbi:major capsid protein [Escherichia coli]|uniref:major capsid protein n=1 Tax=Escherichia coli TaxID=562 RepID=UPI003B28906F